MSTDYGHPERAFFKNFELLGLGRHFGMNFFETIGVFSAGLGHVFDERYLNLPHFILNTCGHLNPYNLKQVGKKLPLFNRFMPKFIRIDTIFTC